MTDLTVTGNLRVDGDSLLRETLFVSSFTRLSALAVVGLVHATGDVRSDQRIVAASGLESTGDCKVGTHLTVSGLSNFAGVGSFATTLNVGGTLTSSALVSQGDVSVARDLRLPGASHVLSDPSAGALPSIDGPGTTINGTGNPGAGVVTLQSGSTDTMGVVSINATTLSAGSEVSVNLGRGWGLTGVQSTVFVQSVTGFNGAPKTQGPPLMTTTGTNTSFVIHFSTTGINGPFSIAYWNVGYDS